MFEFKLSYLEPEFHKPGDPPFLFPPVNVPPKIDSNLIEIRGKNGTGKSTLLNILALAFGYLEETSELKTKPVLYQKLKRLAENKSLEYNFQVTGKIPEKSVLKIERMKNKKQKIYLNNKQTGPEILNNYDLIFLTEDDPEKVVSITVNKLMSYFGSIEKKCLDVTGHLNKLQRDINSYKDYEKRFDEVNDLINKSNIEKKELNSELVKFDELYKTIIERDGTEKEFNILLKETEIMEKYTKMKDEYDKIKDADYDQLFKEYDKLGRNIRKTSLKLHNVINENIKDICRQFKYYNIDIDFSKIINNDYSEIHELRESLSGAIIRESETDLKLVDNMIKIFQRHKHDTIIPLLDMTVSDALEQLYRMRDRMSIESIIPIQKELENLLKERDRTITKITDLTREINDIESKMENMDNFKEIQIKYQTIETEYLELQKNLRKGKRIIISKWEKLKDIKGESEKIKIKIDNIKTTIRIKDQTIKANKKILENLKENKKNPPEYYDKDEQILSLYSTITSLRSQFLNWNNILIHPRKAKQEYSRTQEYQRTKSAFGLSEYNKFTEGIGAFIGDQFEPIDFAGMRHGIKFYDIEDTMFLTDEDRKIFVNDLSQGQSKITSLISSLRRLSSNKKGVILIDEIADLDPENLNYVKNTLKEYLDKGLILLAVLVRPISELGTEAVEISGWA